MTSALERERETAAEIFLNEHGGDVASSEIDEFAVDWRMHTMEAVRIFERLKDFNTRPADDEELIKKIRDYFGWCAKYKRKINKGKVVDWIGYFFVKDRNFKTITDTQETFMYDAREGIYAREAETWIKNRAQEILNIVGRGEDSSTYIINEVVNLVKRLTFARREDLDVDARYTPLANGVYDFETKALLPFSPKFFFTRKINTEYHPEAECPEIEKFFLEICPESPQAFFELAGYMCMRKNDFQKAWLFDGSGNNGKSTLINLLTELVGRENTCSIPLQKFDGNRFATAELESKYLNTVADLSSKDLKDTGIFKAIVGGDMIQAERKGQHPFRFYPWAKLVYSCNALPDSISDDSPAFYRRWVNIGFKQDFTGREDRCLFGRISAKKELQGLLKRGFDAMEQVKASGKFTGEIGVEAMRQMYLVKSNSIKAFMQFFEYDPEGTLIKTKFWQTYNQFCEERKIIPKTENMFWRTVKKEFDVDTKQVQPDGGRVGVIRGIRLKSNIATMSTMYTFFSNLTVIKQSSKEYYKESKECGMPWATSPPPLPKSENQTYLTSSPKQPFSNLEKAVRNLKAEGKSPADGFREIRLWSEFSKLSRVEFDEVWVREL